ncbi:hypothetical protein BESB_049480 [Besnoitia besnoiti]|uniref:Toxoplasma gondii family B protein n=1 Tax=Besnoitia besnoiti TaxID=94643 RepID=A0A2A9ML64_BESBE|nr:hypothetical protein BESB_049480 [Besnoitia besnoiti]PFH36756.1 hypothetical protein BESB_049480 [Besnoitia besnoiti]
MKAVALHFQLLLGVQLLALFSGFVPCWCADVGPPQASPPTANALHESTPHAEEHHSDLDGKGSVAFSGARAIGALGKKRIMSLKKSGRIVVLLAFAFTVLGMSAWIRRCRPSRSGLPAQDGRTPRLLAAGGDEDKARSSEGSGECVRHSTMTLKSPVIWGSEDVVPHLSR